jgi:hypothetical protein
MDGKFTWHQMDNVSWSIGYCGRPIKRGSFDAKLGDASTN